MLAKVETIQKTILERYPFVYRPRIPKGGIQDRAKARCTAFCLIYGITPRNVPFPLREKVQKELARMESLGVIQWRIQTFQ
jgi:hypothetical protein